MTYKELKDFLLTLTDDQLDQEAVVFKGDEELGGVISYSYTSTEDVYWDHGDCLGTETMCKEEHEDWEYIKDEYAVVPAGTITLHIE